MRKKLFENLLIFMYLLVDLSIIASLQKSMSLFMCCIRCKVFSLLQFDPLLLWNQSPAFIFNIPWSSARFVFRWYRVHYSNVLRKESCRVSIILRLQCETLTLPILPWEGLPNQRFRKKLCVWKWKWIHGEDPNPTHYPPPPQPSPVYLAPQICFS